MFWKKDFTTGTEILNRGGGLLCSWEQHEERPEWKGRPLVTRKELEKEIKHLRITVNLLVEHLNLKYVPETEKKEPAKLVKKPDFIINGIEFFGGTEGYMPDEKPKKKTIKKRGRPKGSKNKK